MRAITLRLYSLMFAFAAAQLVAGAPVARADIVPQPNRIRQAFDRLNQTLPDAARQGYPTAWRQAVERARWDALDETRANHDRLGDYHQWGLPFQHIHVWSFKHVFDTHLEAQRAVNEAIGILQTLENEEQVTQAVMAATRIMDAYLQRWRESNAEDAIRLLDEVGEWALAPATRTEYLEKPLQVGTALRAVRGRFGETSLPGISNREVLQEPRTVNQLTFRIEVGGRLMEKRVKNTNAGNVWVSGIYRHQAFFLANEHLFEPDQRNWLRESRENWLQQVASDQTLPLDVRTPVVIAWAQALYNAGQTDRAERCLLAWQQRHGGEIRDASFYAMLMAVPLFGRGDWDRADAIRTAVNARADWFSRPSNRREYERLHRVYYQNLALPGYELRRLRAEQINEYQDRVAAADEDRHLKAIEGANP